MRRWAVADGERVERFGRGQELSMKMSMDRVGVLVLIVGGAWMMEVHASPRSAAPAADGQSQSMEAVARPDAASDKPAASLVPTASLDLR